jgi:glycosyltransferase 2 family protein
VSERLWHFSTVLPKPLSELKMTSRQLKGALGFAIGGLFLYLAVRNVSVTEFIKVLASAKSEWLAVALCIYWMELGARIVRWGALLSNADTKAPLSSTTAAFIIGYAANNVLPAKLGELVRIDLISRLAAVSRMTAFGTVLIERALDVLLILLMAGFSIGLLLLPETLDLARLRDGMILLGFVCTLLLVIGVLLARSGINSRWRMSPLMRGRVGNLLSAVRILANPAKCGRLVALSFLIWALNCLSMWLIAFAFGVTLDFLQTMLLVGVVGVAAVLPAPPAGLGVLQYAFTLVFALLGKPSAVGLVASTTVQVALLGSVTIVGALLFWAVIIPLRVEGSAEDA